MLGGSLSGPQLLVLLGDLEARRAEVAELEWCTAGRVSRTAWIAHRQLRAGPGLRPSSAPGSKEHHRSGELGSLRGQLVLETQGPARVGVRKDKALALQIPEATREHVGGDAHHGIM